MLAPAWTCDLGTVEYTATASLQRDLRAAREAGAIPDTLLTLEHEPVITTGHRTEPEELVVAGLHDVPIVPTDRGGKATYHGPGQLVAYPIFALADHGQDIKAFVRGLEAAIITTLATFGVTADRREGYPGVWVEDRKIASIGLRVTRWISFHGIAINVNCDLAPFTWFTPCGIPDVTMTSIERELGRAVTVDAVRAAFQAGMSGQFGLEFESVAVGILPRVAAVPA